MLANILLGLIMIAGMIYGLFLMGGIDRFVEDEKQSQEQHEAWGSEEPEGFRAVIFGQDLKQERVGAWMEARGLNPIYMEELCLKQEWGDVRCVVALSETDEDNLSVCNLMRRMYHTECLLSVCNEKANESVYNKFQIRIIGKDRIMEDLDTLLKGNEVSIA